MDQVSDIEAKERFGTLLDEVERGGEVTITRDGRPVARLVPEEHDRLWCKPATIEDFARLRSQIAARGEHFTPEDIREMRDAGRR